MAFRTSVPRRSTPEKPLGQRGWRHTVVTVLVTVLLGGVASVLTDKDGRPGTVYLAPPRPESVFEACQSAEKSGECPVSLDSEESLVPSCPSGVRATGAPFALSAP